MAIFAYSAFASTGLGASFFGYVQVTPVHFFDCCLAVTLMESILI